MEGEGQGARLELGRTRRSNREQQEEAREAAQVREEGQREARIAAEIHPRQGPRRQLLGLEEAEVGKLRRVTAPERPQPFANYQFEIYAGGLADQRPKYPLTYAEMEAAARDLLPPQAYGYVAGAAGSEGTARGNSADFDPWGNVPRLTRGPGPRSAGCPAPGAPM